MVRAFGKLWGAEVEAFARLHLEEAVRFRSTFVFFLVDAFSLPFFFVFVGRVLSEGGTAFTAASLWSDLVEFSVFILASLLSMMRA